MFRKVSLLVALLVVCALPATQVHATPFGGMIVSRRECTCTGHYIITVNEGMSQKNLLVAPPMSRLYQYYLFMPGQWALGTYSPGLKCMVQNGQKCEEVPTDGMIDSMPGAGSSGPLPPQGGNSPFADMLKNAMSSLGNLFGSDDKNKNDNNAVNPGRENNTNGQNTGVQLRNITVKNYFIPSEREFSGTSTTPIFDRNGTLIAEANTTFVTDNENGTLFTEDVGLLRDGTVVIYDQTILGTKRYNVLTSGLGLGSTGLPLSPFRSIAVDTTVIPLGSLVQIPRTRGMTLPDGTKHNGVWRADDTLRSTATEDISLFIGVQANRAFLGAEGIRNQESLSVEVLF